jgi:predicted transcriptional regulator
MKETIVIAKWGTITEVADIFGISPQTVRKALNGDTTVKEYSKVRKCALEKGGVQMREVEDNN